MSQNTTTNLKNMLRNFRQILVWIIPRFLVKLVDKSQIFFSKF
mgnify:CR=1 FL=1